MSERRSADSSAPEPGSARPARRSWSPEAIVKAKALPGAGWEQVDTGGHHALPGHHSAAPGSLPTGSYDSGELREGMVPRAPALPRMDIAPQVPPAPRMSVSPQIPARTTVTPKLPPAYASSMQAPRTSMSPTGARPSAPPTRVSGPDPWERSSLTPAVPVASLAPGRGKPEDPAPEQERLYTHALFLREQGRTHEALPLLDELCRNDPEYADARILQLKLALELNSEEHVRWGAEWALHYYGQRVQQHTQACWVYRSVRMAFPQHVWTEKALLQALISADKVGEGRVVVDTTKLLLQGYPQSPALPRALYASAAVQYNEGRPDLARATLQNLIARFPMDPLVPTARRKLVEIA